MWHRFQHHVFELPSFQNEATYRYKGFVTTVSAKCFFQLRQLRRVRRSLDHESTATLVHAFVTSRIDYGNAPVSYTHLTLPTIYSV